VGETTILDAFEAIVDVDELHVYETAPDAASVALLPIHIVGLGVVLRVAPGWRVSVIAAEPVHAPNVPVTV
jgi:hypothetical protein